MARALKGRPPESQCQGISKRVNALTASAAAGYLSPRATADGARLPRLPPALDSQLLENLAYYAPVLLFAMVAHEYAHGYAAMKQGDMTAYQLGRLTWNPVKHIDPFMTVLLPLFMFFATSGATVFGGAKPVPVQPRNYRHYRRGDIIVSLAGVATNLLIAVASAIVYALLGLVGGAVGDAGVHTLAILQRMMVASVKVNLLLMAFNLLPVPPLDGSHVVKHLLPPAWALQYQRIGAFGFFALILLLQFGGPVLSFWFAPARAIEAALLQTVRPFSLSGL